MSINAINLINTISPETEAELEALFAERKPIEPEEPFYHDALVLAPGYTDEIIRVIYSEEDRAEYAEELGCSEDKLSVFFPTAAYLGRLDFHTNVMFAGGALPVIMKTDNGDRDAALMSLRDVIDWLNSPITRVSLSTEAYLSCIACIIDIVSPNFRYLYRSVYWDENLEDGFAEYITSGCYEFDDHFMDLEQAARSYIGLFLEATSYGLDPNDECTAEVLSLTNCGYMSFDGLEGWYRADSEYTENVILDLFEAV